MLYQVTLTNLPPSARIMAWTSGIWFWYVIPVQEGQYLATQAMLNPKNSVYPSREHRGEQSERAHSRKHGLRIRLCFTNVSVTLWGLTGKVQL